MGTKNFKVYMHSRPGVGHTESESGHMGLVKRVKCIRFGR